MYKKVCEERDHYKMNTNPHYTFNSIDYKPPELNPKKVETVQMDRSFDNSPILVENYIPKTERKNFNTEYRLNTESLNISHRTPEKESSPSQHNRTTSSGSIIKYFTNIFKSGK